MHKHSHTFGFKRRQRRPVVTCCTAILSLTTWRPTYFGLKCIFYAHKCKQKLEKDAPTFVALKKWQIGITTRCVQQRQCYCNVIEKLKRIKRNNKRKTQQPGTMQQQHHAKGSLTMQSGSCLHMHVNYNVGQNDVNDITWMQQFITSKSASCALICECPLPPIMK